MVQRKLAGSSSKVFLDSDSTWLDSTVPFWKLTSVLSSACPSDPGHVYTVIHFPRIHPSGMEPSDWDFVSLDSPLQLTKCSFMHDHSIVSQLSCEVGRAIIRDPTLLIAENGIMGLVLVHFLSPKGNQNPSGKAAGKCLKFWRRKRRRGAKIHNNTRQQTTDHVFHS